MSSSLKKVPASVTYPENIPILLVSPQTLDHVALRQVLHHSQWEISQVDGVRAADQYLASHAPSIILCERDLPDGSWKDVHLCAQNLSGCPVLLVMSRHADEGLWAEVLNLGGYDVLLKPFDKSEVARVIGMAWRHWWSMRAASLLPASAPQYRQTA